MPTESRSWDDPKYSPDTGYGRWDPGTPQKYDDGVLLSYPPLYEGHIYHDTPGAPSTFAARYTDTRSKASTTGYWSKLRNGDRLPINPYTRSVTTRLVNRGYGHYRNAGGTSGPLYCWDGQHPNANALPVPGANWEGIYLQLSASDKSKVTDEASTKVRLNVGDQKAGWGENIATANQTIGLFHTNVFRVVNALRSLRRGDIVSTWKSLGVAVRKRQGLRFAKAYAANAGKATAQFWLELQYGWKPLVQDLYGSVELLHRKVSTTATVKRASGKASITLSDRWQPTGFTHTWFESQTLYSVKYIVRYKITDQETRTLQQLGVINPIELAWNLLPYSFVVDWFLPIGNWLQSWSSTIGTTFLDGCVDTKEIYWSSRLDNGRRLESPGHQLTYDFAFAGSQRNFTFKRTPINDYPLARMPHFKNPLSTYHIANALALITTFISQRK